jgi:microcin C transport system substrate-binding protein
VKVTRRKHLHQLGAAFLAPCGTAAFSPLIAAQATPPAWRQGVSLFGDLKYPAGFPRFDYASSSAPTGGRVRQGALGSYDNFNMVTEGARGNLAIGIELIYDTLLLPSMDEAASAYGLLAEAVAYLDDFSWV